MAAVVSRFHPRDFTAVGLQYASFVIGVGCSLPLTRRTTRSLFRQLPLSDPLLEHGGREQVTRFNTFFFKLGERHGPSIVVQAPSHNTLHLGGDLL